MSACSTVSTRAPSVSDLAMLRDEVMKPGKDGVVISLTRD